MCIPLLWKLFFRHRAELSVCKNAMSHSRCDTKNILCHRQRESFLAAITRMNLSDQQKLVKNSLLDDNEHRATLYSVAGLYFDCR